MMRFWLKRKPKLVHDYSLVGYILAPNPTIMAHAVLNKTINHDEAAERLITKLILNPTLVGTERNNERAKLIDTFMDEYGDFTNKRGMFARDNIWIIANDDHEKAYQWHFKYSLTTTMCSFTHDTRCAMDDSSAVTAVVSDDTPHPLRHRSTNLAYVSIMVEGMSEDCDLRLLSVVRTD